MVRPRSGRSATGYLRFGADAGRAGRRSVILILIEPIDRTALPAPAHVSGLTAGPAIPFARQVAHLRLQAISDGWQAPRNQGLNEEPEARRSSTAGRLSMARARTGRLLPWLSMQPICSMIRRARHSPEPRPSFLQLLSNSRLRRRIRRPGSLPS